MKISFFLLFLSIFSLNNCQKQENETYWKSEHVRQADGKAFRGINIAYIDMVAEMILHVKKKGEVLQFFYPYEKEVSMNEYKSISEQKNEYGFLDKVDEIDIENDSLRIKFYFNGDTPDRKYVITFSKISKQNFEKEVQKLNSEKQNLLKKLKSVDASSIDLNIEIPSYLKENADSNILNPFLIAEQLAGNDTGFYTNSEPQKFEMKSLGKFNFHEYQIKNSEKINFAAATIGNIEFSNLKFIFNNDKNRNEAIVLEKKMLKKNEATEIFNFINTKNTNATIEANNSSYLIISWSDAEKVVKLVIYQYDSEWESEENVYNVNDIPKTLEDYLKNLKGPKMYVTIVSQDLSKMLKSEDFMWDADFDVEYNY